MNEADRRKLYREYIRMVAGAVLGDPEWKRSLLDLPSGKRFAVKTSSSKLLDEAFRQLEECQSKGLKMPPSLAWFEEASRQGVRIQQLRVVVFKGSDRDPERVSEPSSRLRFWFGSPFPRPDSDTSERWYTLESVEFPDIRMEFGFSA